MLSAFLFAMGMLCIYGKINNSAYTHRDASFNHWDASYNHQDTRFNHQGAKCSNLYYGLCVNLCCVFMVKSITLLITIGMQVLTIGMQVITVRMQDLTVGVQSAPACIMNFV